MSSVEYIITTFFDFFLSQCEIMHSVKMCSLTLNRTVLEQFNPSPPFNLLYDTYFHIRVSNNITAEEF